MKIDQKKIYQKMRAVVVDLSEVLDEAISFNSYAVRVNSGRQLAYVHAADDFGIGVTMAPDVPAYEAPAVAAEGGQYNDSGRFTRVNVS